MEKIFIKLESALNTENNNINLVGLALSLLATGTIMSIMKVLFG